MNEQPADGGESLSLSLLKRVDHFCCRFEDAWKAGRRPRLEDCLKDASGPERSQLLRQLLQIDIAYRRQMHDTLGPEEYALRFPDYAELIQAVFTEEAFGKGPTGASSSLQGADAGHKSFGPGEQSPPARLGRYRITGKVGEGGFGAVYKGYDDELRRDVAIKVPHRHCVSQPGDIETYLVEARILARLDHPNIVPVYDVGSTGDGRPFVVSKIIEGTDLGKHIKENRLSIGQSAELLAVIAEALHYAHRQHLVHRDIKPGNILIDTSGKSYVTDFGLALREEDVGTGPSIAGTPAYMSPEQARREGHRVDARSDIFSLGVVFYELLTGDLPFEGMDVYDVLQAIKTQEPCPPRRIDASIPRELERICLKALAKRASERYATAKEMADDLRHFLAKPWITERSAIPSVRRSEADLVTPTSSSSPTATDQQAVKIVPKGLRPFDAGDADFFLELLPGPRDRDGLPESIRFWKSRIEETEAEKTFSVGLLYGPSGCGKTSLVKAGLLPRLARSVTAVYVEATAEDTQARLLKGLRRHVPELPAGVGLVEAFAFMRQGRSRALGTKVLVVLDQFEQWLHAREYGENTELVQALRQCDGGRVQGIVLVRVDFWLAVTRFMQAVEIPILEGENSRLADLFDLLHARKVLSEIGRAHGRLPDNLGICSKEQNDFLDQAIAGLAQEGKVISVRLALFAEMVKGKPWTAATLKEVGGTEGVGLTFLEETFTASTAPPQHRLHQKAAQAVLGVLLPDVGPDIKGHMRSQQELLAASGYAGRPREFEELLHILDGELRLITPTDPEGKQAGNVAPLPPGEKYYQLTHDYLVPLLRDWLTRKQRETPEGYRELLLKEVASWQAAKPVEYLRLQKTRRGRAELSLAERTLEWNARQENRYLPSWWEWSFIRLLTRKHHWTAAQKKMMRRATGYHVTRGLALMVMLVPIMFGSCELYGRLQDQIYGRFPAQLLRDQLLAAKTAEVLPIVEKMAPYRRWIDPLLRQAQAQAEKESRIYLHCSLALLPTDPSQVEYIYSGLLDAELADVPILIEALAPYREMLLYRMWTIVQSPEKTKSQRLRVAAALAAYEPDSSWWATVQQAVANELVTMPAADLPPWMAALHPVRSHLLQPLSYVFRDPRWPEAARLQAAVILAAYATGKPAFLADLLMDADEKQFAALYPQFKAQGEPGLPALTAEIDSKLPADAHPDAREHLATRQAKAAVALLRMNQPAKVWPLLKQSPDPRVRTYLIHRLGPLGADARMIVKRLEEEADVTIRRALLLSLGEFEEKSLPAAARQTLLPKMEDSYRNDPDPGIHGAVGWLLRRWGRSDKLSQVDREMRTGKVEGQRGWYVSTAGQTFVIIPGTVRFPMGSPPADPARNPDEGLHWQGINRTFALATTQVTVEQFKRFAPQFEVQKDRYPEPDCPIGGITWYEAAEYCNWLSKQEGLPEREWCYEPNQDGKYAEGMKIPAGYLGRTGYRLPTEAESEYACRAGAATSRYYGETKDLLGKYAWYRANSQNRTWPGGSLKPNDLGLFDMHGNLWTWCQDRYLPYGAAAEGMVLQDKEDDKHLVNDLEDRVLRGGSFDSDPRYVRAPHRHKHKPKDRHFALGLRLARTLR